MRLVTKMRQSVVTPPEIFTTNIARLVYLNAYVDEGIMMHSTRLKLAVPHIPCV